MPFENLANHTNATTTQMNPLQTTPSTLPSGSSLNAFVLIFIIVLVTLLISCAIGHSRMGPSLWSDFRNNRTPTQSTVSPRSSHSSYVSETHPSPTPYSVESEKLWKSTDRTFREKPSEKANCQVLYVCEQVKKSDVMAAARERSSARYPTVHPCQQHDSRLGYPIQVALPDGETHHHQCNPATLRHNYGSEQETELTRGYIKPPENKSLSDLQDYQSFATEAVKIGDGLSGRSRKVHRHSAPLETSSAKYMVSSSSLSDDGSPRRGRKSTFQKHFSQLLSPKCERSARPSSSRDSTQPLLPYPTTTTTLADIAVVPCATLHTAYSQPSYSKLESPCPQHIYSETCERTHSEHI